MVVSWFKESFQNRDQPHLPVKRILEELVVSKFHDPVDRVKSGGEIDESRPTEFQLESVHEECPKYARITVLVLCLRFNFYLNY